MSNQTLINLIREEAVFYGKFDLASGKKSDYYIDLSKVTLRSDGLSLICKEIINKLNYKATAIGGPACGAIPLVSGLCLMIPEIQGFFIRSEERGRKDLIEGCLSKEDIVVLVEDVTTTGNSLLKSVKIVQELGCEIIQLISVVDRGEGAHEIFDKINIPFISILNIKEILE